MRFGGQIVKRSKIKCPPPSLPLPPFFFTNGNIFIQKQNKTKQVKNRYSGACTGGNYTIPTILQKKKKKKKKKRHKTK